MDRVGHRPDPGAGRVQARAFCCAKQGTARSVKTTITSRTCSAYRPPSLVCSRKPSLAVVEGPWPRPRTTGGLGLLCRSSAKTRLDSLGESDELRRGTTAVASSRLAPFRQLQTSPCERIDDTTVCLVTAEENCISESVCRPRPHQVGHGRDGSPGAVAGTRERIGDLPAFRHRLRVAPGGRSPSLCSRSARFRRAE